MIKIFKEPDIFEIIDGRKIRKLPNNVYHSISVGEISASIDLYCKNHKCGHVFINNLDVHLSEKNIFKPDVMVVSVENKKIINWERGIYGVPDMVVEVLSRSTRKNDLNAKKDSYEACGVKEYWIVDPYMKVVDVYLLRDKKYYLDEEYVYYEDEEEFNQLTDEEKANVKSEIKLSIFEDCVVKLEDIFSYNF